MSRRHAFYLSTACLHDEHDYCQSERGITGTKTPAQCKFCSLPCICACHGGPGLPPYEEYDECPACQYLGAHDTTYRPAASSGSPFDEWNGAYMQRGPLPARLERDCARCGYQWDQALPAPDTES